MIPSPRTVVAPCLHVDWAVDTRRALSVTASPWYRTCLDRDGRLVIAELKRDMAVAGGFPPLVKATAVWTVDDLRALAGQANTTVRTILDNCAANPGTAIPYSAVIELSGRTAGQVNGDLAALTVIVKRSFGRRNWPFHWLPGRQGGSAYSMSEDEARLWQQALGVLPAEEANAAP